MAAPTDVSVEAISITSTKIWWTYSGSSGLSLYRSLDNVTYTNVTHGILATDTSYTDTGLSAATRYYYKLSDDFGATYSSVVNVTTHTCLSPAGDDNLLALPRFEGEQQQAADLNEMAERLENMLGTKLSDLEPCEACVTNGAVVIDCSKGCKHFKIIADEDINSITINDCEDVAPPIEIIVPASVTRRICGWPAGYGFGGDECRKMPFVTGTTGGSITVSGGGGSNPASSRGRNSYNPTTRVGGGGGGTGCTCTPINGALTIKSCTANNSLSCQSSKRLTLMACGGIAPYTWSKTGNITLSGTTGSSISVTPPTNSGSAVAGTAYTKGVETTGCGETVPPNHAVVSTWALYKCDDTFDTCSTVLGGVAMNFAFEPDTCGCGTHNGHPNNGSTGTVSCGNLCSPGDTCTCAKTKGAMQDRRTAPMIAANCNPCGLNEGATVSVTDGNGVTTTVILRA